MVMIISPLEESMMQSVIDAANQAQAQTTRNLQAYAGLSQDQPLTTFPGEPNDNVRANVIKPVVNASRDLLFGTPPEIELPAAQEGNPPEDVNAEEAERLDEPQEPDEDPAEEWLEECLRLSDWPVFLLDMATNGGNQGTAIYTIDTDTPNPNKQDPGRPYPRLLCQNPQEWTIYWDPRDITRTTGYEWEYNSTDKATHRPITGSKLYEKQDDGTWLITERYAFKDGRVTAANNNGSTPGSSPAWVVTGTTVWDYQWPPVGHCKNLPAPNSVYGEADFDDTEITLNRAINRSLSNSLRIERYLAYGKPYILGYSGNIDELDTAIGTILGIQGSPQEVQIGQLTPGMTEGQGAGLRAELYSGLLESTSTPSIILGRLNGEAIPSGVALLIRMDPAIRRTTTKRKTYGPMIVELVRRLLELGRWGSDIICSLTWSPIIAGDPAQQVEIAKAEMDAGLSSKERAAGSLGIDWDTEKERIAAEKAEGIATAPPPPKAGPPFGLPALPILPGDVPPGMMNGKAT